jgi:chromosome partitioning protein
MRTTVMEGEFGEFDLASVIQVVSIGRQYTGIELFDETGTVIGTLMLKSGKILAANSGSVSGLDAVTSMLRSERSKRFSVYRTEPFSDVASPVGSVGSILLRFTEITSNRSDRIAVPDERIAVMEGSLVEFDLSMVLQVIGIGRQFTSVELREPGGRPLGTIHVKSGKVISATSDHLSGIDAIRRLARCPRESRFAVYRSRAPVPENPLGSLAQILFTVTDPDDQWDSADPDTQSKIPALETSPQPVMPPSEAPKRPAARSEAPPVAKQRPSARAPAAPPPGETAAPSRPASPAILKRDRDEEQRQPRFLEPRSSPGGLGIVPLRASDVPTIAVTSPKGGAGKTTVALNLAVALVRQGKRVTIVDADANGVLLALNATAKPAAGAYEVIAGKARLSHVALPTRVPGLRVVPSGDPSGAFGASMLAWKQLLKEASVDTDVVLVDTQAGLYGLSGEVCSAATHSLVVLPAEPTAIRALPTYLQRLAALGQAPQNVIGIVLNMLDYRARISLEVLRDLCGGPSAPWVFDIPIARSAAFMEAVARGTLVCRADRTGTPTIGWVFEVLASGILERMGMATPTSGEPILA